MRRLNSRQVAKELQLANSACIEPVYFHGYSMLPILREGDEVIVVPVDWDDLKPGDIVTYRDEEKFPTHRIVKIIPERDLLIIRGDSLPRDVVFEAGKSVLLGRAIARKRDGRWLYAGQWQWQLAAFRALLRSRWWVVRSWSGARRRRFARWFLTAV